LTWLWDVSGNLHDQFEDGGDRMFELTELSLLLVYEVSIKHLNRVCKTCFK